MKRLGATNLADEHPSKLVEMLFHSHPSITARIAAAQQWQEAGVGDATGVRGQGRA